MILSCYLIGEDSLLIQCASQLFAQNHAIALIISPTKSVQHWAQSQGIPWLKSLDELKLSDTPVVDCIFSVVNSRLLPPEIIKLARVAVINYHDSLLPHYAGLHATTWALLNGEVRHGITWHLVNESIDEGDILVQRTFDIEPQDTALTLNLRCYEHAIASFHEVIHCLNVKNLTGRPQDLRLKRYFSAIHLLPDLGFINWRTASATFIDTLSRGLTLGHYENNIGTLKVYLHEVFLHVHAVKINRTIFLNQKPGTLLAVTPHELRVVSCDGAEVSLSVSYKKHALSADFISQHHLIPKAELPLLPNDFILAHQTRYQNALKQEKFWLKKLRQLNEHMTFSSQSLAKKSFQPIATPQDLSPLLYGVALKEQEKRLLSALLIYFFRLNNYEKTDVLVNGYALTPTQNSFSEFFPNFKPLSVPASKAMLSLKAFYQAIGQEYDDILTRPGYLGDIYHRHPSLQNSVAPTITISFTPLDLTQLAENTVIYLYFNLQTKKLYGYHRINEQYHSGALVQLINTFHGHVKTILHQLVNHPLKAVNAFCLLTTLEKRQLAQWGQGKNYEIRKIALIDLFEQQVEQRPHHPALFIGDETISYLELWQKAHSIAQYLKACSITSHALIGIYMSRSPFMLATLLAILKLNCVYVPLDPKYPLGKIDLIINESKLALIATQELFYQPLNSHLKSQMKVQVVNIEQIYHEENSSSIVFNKRRKNQKLEQLVYIMFTSGTTGIPKGVMISQQNVLNYCTWFAKTTRFDQNCIIDFSSSLAFDLSVPCTLAPLLAGGSIAICPEPDKVNPKRYLQHLQRYRVTHTELTPGYLELLLHYPEAIQALGSLRYLLLGADILHTTEVSQWLALCPHVQVVNEYGPTETTVSVTSYFVNPRALVHESAVPIGKPAFNSQAYIVDKYHNLCPAGMKGELCIGGAQVALGYLNKPQLTAEKFVSLPLSGQKKLLVYKTGDEVCWLLEGEIQFFGRNDSQVKIHGYRVEVPAIETLLMQHPLIHQAVVMVKQQAREKYLRAYLVVDDTELSLTELTQFLAHVLPFYMIPKEFCLVDVIPLKENEKIDFEGLESQPQKRLTPHAYTATNESLTPTQERCLSIWQMIFNQTLIQLDDNFFDLGGDSLMALQIITSLKNHYALPISLAVLFECPTISLLAAKIDELLAENKETKLIKVFSNQISHTLVKLATGPYPVPLFLVHPVGGSIFWYQQLAQELQGQYTIYGIQDPSIEGDIKRFKTLEEMASFYLEAIATVYQGKRYWLGGASFGATVAFEMAHQLCRADLNVEFLGLLDGWAHYPHELMQDTSLSLLSHNNQQLTKEQYEELIALEEYRKQLLLNYQLPALDCEVTLLKAGELWSAFRQIDDPWNGWRPFVRGSLRRHIIPGSHESMFFNPHVNQLASTLINLIKDC